MTPGYQVYLYKLQKHIFNPFVPYNSRKTPVACQSAPFTLHSSVLQPPYNHHLTFDAFPITLLCFADCDRRYMCNVTSLAAALGSRRAPTRKLPVRTLSLPKPLTNRYDAHRRGLSLTFSSSPVAPTLRRFPIITNSGMRMPNAACVGFRPVQSQSRS